jgi:uncharacterized protein YndB with AHSA1/START domain
MPKRSAVDFDVPAEVAFDYLADPRNRPQWQSSLRRVELVDHGVRVGQRWVDVTAAGVRPRMETTVLDRPTTWTERGAWRGVTATLTLVLEPTARGCCVEADFEVSAAGWARPFGPAITRAGRLAVPRDLRRAARILSGRAAAH